jgi:hypothetical protein
MESHEEKLHKMIIQSKINDTKDIMKRKVSQLPRSYAAGPCITSNLHAGSNQLLLPSLQ